MAALGRILVIEDDPETSRLFVEVLSEAGFGATACVRDHLPSTDGLALVLTDLRFDGTGYSSRGASEWVSGLRERYRVPVMVVTGHVAAARDEILVRSAADVMAKPVDIDDLVARVGRALAP